jgi:hypothetical protein
MSERSWDSAVAFNVWATLDLASEDGIATPDADAGGGAAGSASGYDRHKRQSNRFSKIC